MEARPDDGDQKRLLIVDDDPSLCDFISDIAQEEGYSVAVAHRVKDFMGRLPSFHPHFNILDLDLLDRDDMELLKVLGEQKCDAKIIVTGYHGQLVLNKITKLGEAYGLRMHTALQKPFGQGELKNALA